MNWRSHSVCSLVSLTVRQFSSWGGSCPLHFAYTLSSSPQTLYVPITSRCNSQSLPETRGPSFVLPAVAVAALCRVRDAENGVRQWEPWCQWLDTQDASIGLPPPRPTSSEASEERISDPEEPSFDTLLNEIKTYQPKTVVIAGEGEPFLRPQLVLDLVEALSSLSATAIRINTNGLAVPPDTYQILSRNRNNITLSIALMTADPDQYAELMQPTSTGSHARVVDCIQSAIAAELCVELTGVVRDGVDQAATERFAEQLGYTEPVRWRTYFP